MRVTPWLEHLIGSDGEPLPRSRIWIRWRTSRESVRDRRVDELPADALGTVTLARIPTDNPELTSIASSTGFVLLPLVLDASVKELRPLKADPAVAIPLSAGVTITITELTAKQVKCVLEGDRVEFVKLALFSKDGIQLESGALSSSTMGGKTRRTYSPRGGSLEGAYARVSYPTSEMALEIPLELENIPLP